MTPLISDDNYLRAVLDALPSAVFVVDPQFRIRDVNPPARDLFGIDSGVVLRRLCGEIMHCINALRSKQVCGTTASCPDCVIRNAVESAARRQDVKRTRYRMKIQRGEAVSDVHMLVSASPFSYDKRQFVLLAIENITEIITLKRLIPICASCNKIRNDDNYWEAVADYLRKTTDLEFTHSLCDQCARRLYPEVD